MKLRSLFLMAVLPISTLASAQSLYDKFKNPSQEWRPRVWWHWMNGNISKHGIRKDIEWMQRAGIGGFHIFDAGMATPQVVPERLIFMTPEWKDALRYAVNLGDSLGMEVAMTSAPGWSNTGGPWVKPEDAMKKLTWRTVNVKGGKTVTLTLPAPYKTTGFFQNVPPADNATTFITGSTNDEWYKDIKVIAVKSNVYSSKLKVKSSTSDSQLSTLNSQLSTLLSDGDLSTPLSISRTSKDEKAWIEYRYSKPTTVRSLSICDGTVRSEWADSPAPITKHLQTSDDGKLWRDICDIPTGGAALQTIDIPETTARYFRVVFDAPASQNPYAELNGDATDTKPEPINVYEFVLSPELKINHAEEKAGFASPFDLAEYQTPDGRDYQIARFD